MIDFKSSEFASAFLEEKERIHKEVNSWDSDFRAKTKETATLTFPRSQEPSKQPVQEEK